MQQLRLGYLRVSWLRALANCVNTRDFLIFDSMHALLLWFPARQHVLQLFLSDPPGEHADRRCRKDPGINFFFFFFFYFCCYNYSEHHGGDHHTACVGGASV